MYVLALATFLTMTPESVLEGVQATYKKAGDLTASFTQIRVDKLRGKKKVESGRFWAKGDGRVRWTYEKPVIKDFVYDGKAAYMYEPENAQVTIFEKFQDSPLWNAMRFLWGQGTLTQTFDVKACVEKCPETKPGEVVVKLVPKEPIASVDHIMLVVDEKQSRVRESIIFDPLGNRTEYHFTDVQFGATIDDKKFVAPPTKGLNQQRYRGDGAP